MGAPDLLYTVYKFDELVKSPTTTITVIPARRARALSRQAKAGHVVTRSEASALTISAIQSFQVVADHLDSGFHRSDDFLRSHQILIIIKYNIT